MKKKGFTTEPEGYERTAVSDLQGAWGNLRSEVVKANPFKESKRLLFHIDEAMSWDAVRDFARMKAALLLVRNIAAQHKMPKEVSFWVEEVVSAFEEAEEAIAKGEARQLGTICILQTR